MRNPVQLNQGEEKGVYSYGNWITLTSTSKPIKRIMMLIRRDTIGTRQLSHHDFFVQWKHHTGAWSGIDTLANCNKVEHDKI